jgi:hypothetical protein
MAAYSTRVQPSFALIGPAAAILLLTSACGGGSQEAPTAPSPTVTAPTSPTPAASVRWVGTSPDGMIVDQDPSDQCPAEFDIELNLTTSGTTVTGTATTRLRRVEARGPCGDVLGQVANWSVNGRLESDNISFDLGNTLSHRFTGTIAGTRMTGRFEITQFPQSGRFAVTRQ